MPPTTFSAPAIFRSIIGIEKNYHKAQYMRIFAEWTCVRSFVLQFFRTFYAFHSSSLWLKFHFFWNDPRFWEEGNNAKGRVGLATREVGNQDAELDENSVDPADTSRAFDACSRMGFWFNSNAMCSFYVPASIEYGFKDSVSKMWIGSGQCPFILITLGQQFWILMRGLFYIGLYGSCDFLLYRSILFFLSKWYDTSRKWARWGASW